jgi:hypothetical protein
VQRRQLCMFSRVLCAALFAMLVLQYQFRIFVSYNNRAGGLVHSEWTTFTKMHFTSMISGAVLIKFGLRTYRGNISNY